MDMKRVQIISQWKQRWMGKCECEEERREKHSFFTGRDPWSRLPAQWAALRRQGVAG